MIAEMYSGVVRKKFNFSQKEPPLAGAPWGSQIRLIEDIKSTRSFYEIGTAGVVTFLFYHQKEENTRFFCFAKQSPETHVILSEWSESKNLKGERFFGHYHSLGMTVFVGNLVRKTEI